MYALDPNVAYPTKEFIISKQQKNLIGAFNITGNFLGKFTLFFCKIRQASYTCTKSTDMNDFKVRGLSSRHSIDILF